MFLINYGINLILTLVKSWVIFEGNRVTTSVITDTRFYVPVVNLATQNNRKLLLQ